MTSPDIKGLGTEALSDIINSFRQFGKAINDMIEVWLSMPLEDNDGTSDE